MEVARVFTQKIVVDNPCTGCYSACRAVTSVHPCKTGILMTNREKILSVVYGVNSTLSGITCTIKKRGFNQTYVAISARPYTDKNGLPSAIVEWESQCKVCAEVFRSEAGCNPNHAPATCSRHRQTVRGTYLIKHRKGQKCSVQT
jgi:hypothetical protein